MYASDAGAMTEPVLRWMRRWKLRRSWIALAMTVMILALNLHVENPLVATAEVTRQSVQRDDNPVWVWPVEPPQVVTAPYRAPATAYSSGHRGIDLRATHGQYVLAPADGHIYFVGTVVDRPVLTIAVDDTTLASFEPVEALATKGENIAQGQVVGIVRSGGHCADACLHFGVRVHGEYVSPMLFLGGVPRAVLLSLDQ
jgi:murein DD-endopeptidase MepM/ murein hydrolase activator NlpD